MSRGPTARLFVALELPGEVREILWRWARGVARARGAGGHAQGGLRVLEPATLHLTLHFLGSRPVGEIGALGAALGPCADHAFELALGAPLWLPPREPRSLAVAVHEDSGELERMHAELGRVLSELCDLEPARRRFRPHITVARLRGRPRRRRRGREEPDAGEGPTIALVSPSLRFMPESLVLYRSTLLPSGAEYEALASSALAPA